jgi:hypothetical protein
MQQRLFSNAASDDDRLGRPRRGPTVVIKDNCFAAALMVAPVSCCAGRSAEPMGRLFRPGGGQLLLSASLLTSLYDRTTAQFPFSTRHAIADSVRFATFSRYGSDHCGTHGFSPQWVNSRCIFSLRAL